MFTMRHNMKRNITLVLGLCMSAVLTAQNQEIKENPIANISQNPGFCSIFHYWGFIGDSLCSGEFEYTKSDGSKGYWDCYEYAWGQRMCDLMGVQGEIFSKGGETAKGWIKHFWDSNDNKLHNCAKDNPKQVYVIALGVNDANPKNIAKNYPLGNFTTDVNMEDYTKNDSTFIGCYAGIIQRLKEMQPEVKIFTVTMPDKDKTSYNDAIRMMSEKFSDVWVIDLAEYAVDFYSSPEFKTLYQPDHHGHLTPAGYEYTAWEFMTYIDWIIRHDMSAFKEVGFMLPDAPDRFSLRELVECSPRTGAPNFYKKLQSKVPEVRIAYFGGSITAQNGWRVYSREYFQSQYPDTQIKEINAAIGGTATDLGVFRCWHDVIKEKPDLVYIEFACNDSGTPPVPLRKNLEGIIRQIWDTDPSIDIVFVYVVTNREQELILKGKMQHSASIMEDIADYYSIPSINFGASLKPMLETGTLVMKSDTMLNEPDGKVPFSGDGVHPYENTGHILYERALERSMPLIKDASSCSAKAHIMPAPMEAGCLSQVCTISFEDSRVSVSGPWSRDRADDPETSDFQKRTDYFYTFEPGAEISFKFKGSAAAIYDLLGPQCGSIIISVDGEEPKTIHRIDGYCTYHRLALLKICSEMDPSVVHTVNIKISETSPDKRGMLFENNRGDYDSHPEKYAPIHYFAGCIFIAGEIVK